MLSALGVKFINGKGEVIEPSGGTLHSIVSIDFSQMDSRLKHIKIEAACDVDNPLVGIKEHLSYLDDKRVRMKR